jgi:hypothetical protein
MKFDNYWVDAQGNRDEIWLDKMTLTNASLEFDVSYAEYGVPYSDTMAVVLSTDCGNTWSEIWMKGGNDLATAPDNTNAFIPDSSQWRHEVVSLSSFEGQEVIIAFQNRGRYGNQLYVDNINVVTNFSAETISDEVGKLYPNPALDEITFASKSVTAQSRWAVLDAQGKEVVLPMNVQEGKLVVHLKSLAAGQYFLRSLSNAPMRIVPFIKK